MQSLCSLSFSLSLNQAFQIWLEISLRWTYTNERFDEILCGPSRSEFSYARLSLSTPKRSQENVEHTFLGRNIWGNYKHMAPKGWINCNLSVLAESTESISGDAIPADMLDMKYFSELLLWTFFADVTRIWQLIEWLAGLSLPLLQCLFWLHHSCSNVDRIKLQPNGSTGWGKGLLHSCCIRNQNESQHEGHHIWISLLVKLVQRLTAPWLFKHCSSQLRHLLFRGDGTV